MSLSRLLLIFISITCLIANTNAQTINNRAKLKYFGYYWLQDPGTGFVPGSAVTAKTNLNAHNLGANLNLVQTTDAAGLNSSACDGNTCMLQIFGGSKDWSSSTGAAFSKTYNICPAGTSYQTCFLVNPSKPAETSNVSSAPFSVLWNAVADIKTLPITRRPSAIYLLDEPDADHSNVLRWGGTSGNFVQYSYSSLVCTLRQALNHHNLSHIRIHTVLTYGNTAPIKQEITSQMPSGCPAEVRSFPDAVGINNYGMTTASDIYAKYSTLLGTSVNWILVPPMPNKVLSSVEPQTLANGQINPQHVSLSDSAYKSRIQAYWDFLWNYYESTAPVEAVMMFKYDPLLFTQPYIGLFTPQ